MRGGAGCGSWVFGLYMGSRVLDLARVSSKKSMGECETYY